MRPTGRKKPHEKQVLEGKQRHEKRKKPKNENTRDKEAGIKEPGDKEDLRKTSPGLRRPEEGKPGIKKHQRKKLRGKIPGKETAAKRSSAAEPANRQAVVRRLKCDLTPSGLKFETVLRSREAAELEAASPKNPTIRNPRSQSRERNPSRHIQHKALSQTKAYPGRSSVKHDARQRRRTAPVPVGARSRRQIERDLPRGLPSRWLKCLAGSNAWAQAVKFARNPVSQGQHHRDCRP